MRFKDLKLTYQINLITLIGVIGFVLVAVFIGRSFNEFFRYQERQGAAQVALVQAEEMKYFFLNARRDEKDFLIRKDMKYAGRHAKTLGKIHEEMDALEVFHAENGVVLTHLKSLHDHVVKYEDQFNKVADDWTVLGLTEKLGLQGALRASVQNVEAKLKTFNVPELAVSMLMMRRHEKDFILRLDPKYVGRMEKRLAEFKEFLAASTVPQEEHADILKLMMSYHADFNKYAALRQTLVGETNELSKLFSEAQPDLDAVFSLTVKEYERAVSAFKDTAHHSERVLLLMAIVASALMALGGYLIVRNVVGSLGRVGDVMNALAGGKRDVDVPNTRQKNEIGAMCRSVAHFKEKLIEAEVLRAEQAKAQEEQVARAREISESTAQFDRDVKAVLEGFEQSLEQMKESTETVTSSASSVNNEAGEVSAAATQSATNVQTVATASEELAASIQEIGSLVTKSTSASNGAVDQVVLTNEKVQGLSEAAERIGNVVKVISDIAEQTNLLALNATIESARAGDAGKGFAVVANEVKTLAGQTVKATEEISVQIAEVQSATQDAVQAMAGISTVITDVNEISTAIASAIEEQQAATSEIARNIEEAAAGTSRVTRSIHNVSSAAEESEGAADMMQGVTLGLADNSRSLSDSVRSFIAKISEAA